MAIISSLVVALTATTSEFEKGLESAEKRLDRFAGRFEGVGVAMSEGLTAPILALGEESVRFAVEFEEGIMKMGASLGQTRGQVDQLRNSVLRMAGETGQGPRELAQDLNSIETAGLRGQAALDVLRVSAKAATVGLGDLKNVSSTLTAAINAYGPGALSAGQATSVLLAAVRESRVSGDEFLSTIRGILPLASNLGVSIDQVAAAMATMTRTGLDAGQASGALRSVFSSLEKPTTATKKALEEMGLSAADLREELKERGLLAVLQTLADGFKVNGEALTKVFPNARALAGVLSLLGGDGKNAAAVFKTLAGTTTDTLNKAFEEAASGPGFKFHQAMAELQVVLIRIGDDVLPRILPVVQAFSAGMEALADRVAALTPATQTWIIALAASMAALGPIVLMIAGFYNALSTVAGGLALLWRVGSIVFGGLISVATTLVSGFNQIVVVFEALEPALMLAIGAITGPGLVAFGLFAGAALLIGSRWQELKTDLSIIFSWIADQVRDTFVGKVIDYLGRFASYAKDLLSKFGVAIKETVKPAWDGITDYVSSGISSATGSMESGFSGMIAKAKKFASDLQRSLAGAMSGTALPKPGIAAGEIGTSGTPKAPSKEEMGAWDAYFATIKTDVGGARTALTGFWNQIQDRMDAYQAEVAKMESATAQSMGAMAADFAKGRTDLNSFVAQMIEAIGKLIAKIMLLKALTAVGLGGPFAAGFVGGMFADGGRPPMGKVSVVGERGPELFVPDTAGTIVPMDGRGGGGVTVQVSQTFSFNGMDYGSRDSAQRLLVAAKAELQAGTRESIEFALQSAKVADRSAGRAV